MKPGGEGIVPQEKLCIQRKEGKKKTGFFESQEGKGQKEKKKNWIDPAKKNVRGREVPEKKKRGGPGNAEAKKGKPTRRKKILGKRRKMCAPLRKRETGWN